MELELIYKIFFKRLDMVEESKKEAEAEQSVLEIIEKTDGKTLFEYTRFY